MAIMIAAKVPANHPSVQNEVAAPQILMMPPGEGINAMGSV